MTRDEWDEIRDELLREQRVCAWCGKRCKGHEHLGAHIMLRHPKEVG